MLSTVFVAAVLAVVAGLTAYALVHRDDKDFARRLLQQQQIGGGGL
jgi:hypothetical protein